MFKPKSSKESKFTTDIFKPYVAKVLRSTVNLRAGVGEGFDHQAEDDDQDAEPVVPLQPELEEGHGEQAAPDHRSSS